MSDEQWAGVPIPLNVRPDSGVRVIAAAPNPPAPIPDMPALSDPSVVGVRVTFFPRRTIPWVEVWVRRPEHDDDHCDLDWPTPYAYYDIHRPPCDTQEEWLALLATGQSTTLVPTPGSPPVHRGSI